MILRHCLQRIDSLPAHAAEIRCAGSDPRTADAINQSIKSGRRKMFKGNSPCILDPLRLNNIITLLEEFDHLRNQLRGMLSIAIEGDDKVAPLDIQTIGQI